MAEYTTSAILNAIYSNGTIVGEVHTTGDILNAVYDPASACLKINIQNFLVQDDIEITDFTKGIILRSPDGSRWRITVNNAGLLVQTEL